MRGKILNWAGHIAIYFDWKAFTQEYVTKINEERSVILRLTDVLNTSFLYNLLVKEGDLLLWTSKSI